MRMTFESMAHLWPRRGWMKDIRGVILNEEHCCFWQYRIVLVKLAFM